MSIFNPIISKQFPQKYKYNDQTIIINRSIIDYIDRDMIYRDIPYQIDTSGAMDIGINKLCRIFIGTDGSLDLKARKDIPESVCIYTGHMFMKIATAIADILNIELSLYDASKIKIGFHYISLKLLRALQLRPSFYEDYQFEYKQYPIEITPGLITKSEIIMNKYNDMYNTIQSDFDQNVMSIDQYSEHLFQLTMKLQSELIENEKQFPGIFQYSIPSTSDSAIRLPTRKWIEITN